MSKFTVGANICLFMAGVGAWTTFNAYSSGDPFQVFHLVSFTYMVILPIYTYRLARQLEDFSHIFNSTMKDEETTMSRKQPNPGPPQKPGKRPTPPKNPPLAPATHDAREWKPTHRHNKGGKYRILHVGTLESDLTPVVIYQALDGTIWVRPSAEFNDGRFTKIED
jgi:Protein of unknown function (DUF1653)